MSPSDFEVASGRLPPVKSGQLLVRNQWLAVDASTMWRLIGTDETAIPRYRTGEPLEGWAVGVIEASRSAEFVKGQRVVHNSGWRDFAVLDADAGWGGPSAVPVDADRPQDYLGRYGVTGLTAWAGLCRVAEIEPGDLVYVSAGAGAVGCIAVQLAKSRGCRVVASAGTDAKVTLLRDTFGADAAFNYRREPVSAALPRLADDGIDVYFDNVGGEHLDASLCALRPGGKVVLCGSVSGYASSSFIGVRQLFQATTKGLRLEGFLARMYADDFHRARTELSALGDRLVVPETVYSGLEAAPTALLDLIAGVNVGKTLVRLPE